MVPGVSVRFQVGPQKISTFRVTDDFYLIKGGVRLYITQEYTQ